MQEKYLTQQKKIKQLKRAQSEQMKIAVKSEVRIPIIRVVAKPLIGPDPKINRIIAANNQKQLHIFLCLKKPKTVNKLTGEIDFSGEKTSARCNRCGIRLDEKEYRILLCCIFKNQGSLILTSRLVF